MPDVSHLPEGCPPLTCYYFYLTHGCNLACQHCWLAPKYQPHGDTGGHLHFDLFVQAIEEGLPLGLTHAKLTGGEPLLHPDFTRMVTLLRDKGLGLTIETNGTLLTREIANLLNESRILSFITVSLDGANEETHDAFRGVKGSFHKACQGISYLVQAGLRPQVIMTVHQDNVDEIENLVHLAQDIGASSIKVGITQASGRGRNMFQREKMLSFDRLIELGHWIDTYLQPKFSIPIYYNWPAAYYTLSKLLTFSGYSCQIFNILGILPDGTMALCGIGEQVPELCFGKLREDLVSEVWRDNAVLLDLRQMIPGKFEGICGECLLKNVCLGACVAQSYQLTKNLKASYWFCQKANELGLFPASRID